MTSGYFERLPGNSMWILAALLLALVDPAVAAKPEQDRGVIIPDAERIYAGLSTDIRETAEGAIWSVALPRGQAWQVLKGSLQRLGIGFTETGGETPQLLTDWVTWGYDASNNVAHSKRPRIGSGGTDELHRFRFEFAADGADQSSQFKVSDIARQKMIDIAPDSEYLWLEWRDHPLQAGAAFTFGRRLQGEYQAAMSLQTVTVSPRQAVAPVVAAPKTAVIAIPVLNQPTGETTISTPIVPPPAGIPDVSVTARAESPVAVEYIPTTTAETATGLLVDFPVDTVWDALLRALDELRMGVETADRSQLMIATRWVDADYEKKNQQLHFRSKDDSGWAFDWGGDGPQHHRFQLILIGDGEKTLVRAYHTGFQEQVDQTPDSSQTLMAWKDRKTNPDIAAALLRRLRIVADR